jgi:hypothetical protein
MPKVIEDAWRELEAMSIPEAAGPLQRSEMRKAFFAGAAAALAELAENGGDPGPMFSELLEFTSGLLQRAQQAN